ncbi:uncharacterized protein STEHIDRAFT_127305 [Stereum hirsutum FP-91666 SS1]|uniref:uncharacterized protein n=1 Tax=Stereum hirsutum (strain FP-91666) TaxID=721885 RepID=UPI000440B488|nr:uncharacterized protein STEHIDRAFT_127305 [Stereum hirsutum FP-91666 SS1]EIM92492.1 hypothetical protein STEHIDRAFT_127305 [Stereum hirsutum FP-91666 SS1]
MDSPQVVLDAIETSYAALAKEKKIWTHTLMIPAYVAVASALVLIIHLVLSSGPLKRLIHQYGSSEDDSVQEETSRTTSLHTSLLSAAREHVAELGGPVIFAFRAVRALAVLALCGLSIAIFVLDEEGNLNTKDFEAFSKSWGKKHKKSRTGVVTFTKHEWLEFVMCLTYFYASLLAVCSIAAGRKWSHTTKTHLLVVLFATFLVLAYRNIWPLLTFTLQPADLRQGALLWAHLSLLAFAAVVIPLAVPRPYVPLDPKEPTPEPPAEQTASIFSMAIYSFLDPTVFLAYRIPHLSFNQLPPLADYDHAKNLVNMSFPHLDTFSGSKKQHLFWGFMKIFRREYIVLAALLLLKVACNMLSPIGINGLLRYIEGAGEGAFVRPWVWISALFWAPVIGTLAIQWYIFLATGMLVRVEAIVTQLVFEHSLRIRMKAETESSGSTPSPSAAATEGTSTPADTASLANTSTVHDGSEANESDDGAPPSSTLSASSTPSSTIKGKPDAKPKGGDKKEEDDEKFHKDGTAKASNLIGKINNLVSTDLNNIVDGRDFLFLILYTPVQIIGSVIFLYTILGWSAFVGMGVMILLFPLPGYVAKLIQTAQVATMKTTDARVQTVTETMNVLRMIKLFGWEPKINERVAEKRDDELRWIRRRQLLNLLNGNMNYIIPAITMIVTYFAYTVWMGKDLTASAVFASMAAFDILRDQLHSVFFLIPVFIQAKVSLDRVTEFLQETELLDTFTESGQNEPAQDILEGTAEFDKSTIGFRGASFTWSSSINNTGSATSTTGTTTPGSGAMTPSRRNFVLHVEDELLFKRGKVNLIIGPTGSGKTSLLMALLGEMHFVPSGPGSWFNLPREGGVAYAAQESWVQNETIKDNILFGTPYDEERYNKVIYQCGLKRDLTLFEAGDQTEVGEKGLTLSGGQKARITLARAIYSSAEIILLDDVLAALDVHTARWIVDKCFKGSLVNGRTILLVTHNIAMATPIADYVVSVGLDGRISSHGSVQDALAKNKELSAEVADEVVAIEKDDTTIDAEEPNEPAKKADGKLTVAEEIAEGHVSWPALKLYFAALGGNHNALFWTCFLGSMVLSQVLSTVQTWFLGYWANQYEIHDSSEVNIFYYLTVYVILLLVGVIIYSIGSAVFVFGSLSASRSIHKRLISSILGTTLRWLDTTPVSRVITRCTQDIRAMDGPVAQNLGWVTELTVMMVIKLAAVVILTPAFIMPGILVFVIGGWCGQIYIKAQLSVKREMSNAKAPVLGHFGAAIAGLTSIRAYGAQLAFRQESYRRIDRYTRAARTFYNLNRWICVRIDTLGGLFAAGLAAYLIYGPAKDTMHASDTGFSLTMAVGFSGLILWWVRVLNEFEVSGNSLERIQAYITIEQEPKSTPEGVPPAYWPSSGDIRVENLSARYSPDGPEVLHDISFHIKSGERIGVVGRTGSGKSSLTLSLLRCIFTQGTVYYDGIPTSSLNLDSLRTRITIIPQMPELLSGSLRENLDPFGDFDDAVLNSALRASGLFSLQTGDDEGRITLDTKISSGGSNLSVGQRQILALARAIVRGSKLLILDEDYETDSVIQSSLRHELKGDVTLITVAHRLQTIMDADKIMVLDAGRIVEFDKPNELLKNREGRLRALVDDSGDREALYHMADADAEMS